MVVKLLLDRGADVKAKVNDGATPLWWPATEGKVEVVKLLLEKGADANEKGNTGVTVLMWAAGKGHTKANAQMLLEAGADVKAKRTRRD